CFVLIYIVITGASAKNLELKKSNSLEKCLIPYGVLETRRDSERRLMVLGTLHQVWRQWVREESLRKGLSVLEAESVGGNVFPFGSYRLGVHFGGHNADIDAVCVAPRHIERSDFFGSFYDMLQGHPKVTHLRATENDGIPLIRLKFDGVRLNLPFARLDLSAVPESVDLRDTATMKNLDPMCERSLHGCRVTDEILRLVPNFRNFRLTLRALKLWAKRRRVYSKVMGFIGFETLAMLVAYTCQQYPDALPATLVHTFFRTFSEWKWPQPVVISPPTSNSLSPFIQDPTTDSFKLDPSIMPVYPEFNTCGSTRGVVMKELKLGLAITNDIWQDKCEWDALFKAPKFFSCYKQYVVVDVSSASPDDQFLCSEFVETKIRSFIGLAFDEARPDFNLSPEIRRFSTTLNYEAFQLNLLQKGMRTE
ncbi:hypothetical protein SFRURICE_006766, partial [Spodoptera frugiperda]